jgi:PIN domain nuclease of toxin-antitoxin system
MLLLDTCTILWLAADQSKLPASALRSLVGHRDALYFSAISAWEIAWKHRRGKLSLPLDPRVWLALAVANHGLQEVTIDRNVALTAALLPEHHKDPCDRFLIATAQVGGFALLTPDPEIHKYTEANAVW